MKKKNVVLFLSYLMPCSSLYFKEVLSVLSYRDSNFVNVCCLVFVILISLGNDCLQNFVSIMLFVPIVLTQGETIGRGVFLVLHTW